jgi:hypothetical protein
MKLKQALILAFFMACLSECTYEFMSKYEAWLIGLVIGTISGLFIYSVTRKRPNQ